MLLAEALELSGTGRTVSGLMNANWPAICKAVKIMELDKANVMLDYVTDLGDQCIILVVPPVIEENRGVSGAWKSTSTLRGSILFRIEDYTTIGFESNRVELEACAPARSIGRKFFNRLSTTDVIDSDTDGIIKVKYNNVYGIFDAHLFGVNFEAEVPFVEDPTSCTS